jgi:transcriptional regulator with XRE-family HTH domain
VGKEILTARMEFANQLKAYRKAANVSQVNLADAIGKQQPYIVLIEGGEFSFGIDMLETISNFFGVKLYEFLDPSFPIPSQDELHKNIKHFVTSTQTDSSYLNNRAPSYAYNLDLYIKSGMLREQKTSVQIAKEYFEMFKTEIHPGKITDIFTRAPRNVYIKVIKPDKGRGNQYISIQEED